MYPISNIGEYIIYNMLHELLTLTLNDGTPQVPSKQIGINLYNFRNLK